MSRYAVKPSTRTLSARPTTNWLAVNRWLRLAWIKATSSPAAQPTRIPNAAGEDQCMPSAAPKAPARSIPSTEMFRVPARSATHSPLAANRNTTDSWKALMYSASAEKIVAERLEDVHLRRRLR